MSLSQIISISVTRNTSSADRASFGTPIFVTGTVPGAFTERVRKYTSLSGLVTDGFATTDNAYKAAQSFFSQNPSIQEIYIGRQDVGDADWSATLDAIIAENNDWYVLTTEERTKADVLEIAAYIEALDKKMYFVATAEAESITTVVGSGTDTAASLFNAEYDKTVHFWHQDAATAFHECAFAGYNLPFDAGKATWCYLQLNGVTEAKDSNGNPLSETAVTNLTARNSNFSQTIAGVTVTREGKVVGGEWIDVIRGIDELTEDMEKSLFDLLINQQGGKLPYSSSGLNVVRGVMSNVLTRKVNNGFIQDDFRIVIPNISSISVSDKTNRVLNGITFEANLVGAIHEIKTLVGNITYEGA